MPLKKILIAIANDFTSNVFSKIFLQENFEVIIVHTGSQALKEINENKPEIVIVDVALEEISGFELIESLKKNDTTSKVPIIVYSRSGSSDHREKSINLGVTDFINGLTDSPKEIVSRAKIHLGAQKSYLVETSKKSEEKIKELAEDIKENFKCHLCGSDNSLYLLRNLNAGEKDFKVSFICPKCSFQRKS